MFISRINRKNMIIVIGYIIIVYWIIFYIFSLLDLYLSYPLFGDILKVFFPVAFTANFAGMFLGYLFCSSTRTAKIMICTLHGIPVLVALWFIWWLFFSIRI